MCLILQETIMSNDYCFPWSLTVIYIATESEFKRNIVTSVSSNCKFSLSGDIKDAQVAIKWASSFSQATLLILFFFRCFSIISCINVCYHCRSSGQMHLQMVNNFAPTLSRWYFSSAAIKRHGKFWAHHYLTINIYSWIYAWEQFSD